MSQNIGNYTIADCGNELSGLLHGTTLNQIVNLYGVYTRAARRVLQDVDPQETKVDVQFGQVWDSVFDYPLPVDVKGNKVIDLYPQANRRTTDNLSQVYNKQFDLWKNYTLVPDFTPRYSNGNRTIRVNATHLNAGIQLNAADGIATNGTWSTGGNASNIQNDNQYYTSGAAGSVSFQLNQTGVPGSTGYVENSTMGAIDLTQHYNNAYEFFQTYLPTATGFSSIEYRYGTDSSNYYTFTVAGDYSLNTWVNGWNQNGASWSTATTVGTPTLSQIKYIRVIFTYNGTVQTQVRINQFFSRLGVIFNINYYSKYLFRDATTGLFKEKVTADTDIINLDTDGFNLFLYAAASEACEQQQGLAAMFFDSPTFDSKYNDTLGEYQSKYKSEISKPRENYYTQPSKGYRRFMGRGSYWR